MHSISEHRGRIYWWVSEAREGLREYKQFEFRLGFLVLV